MRRLQLVVSGGLAAALACTPAGREGGSGSEGNRYGLRGDVLEVALEKPAVMLMASDGRAFDLRRETDGYLTLVFFGYTSCPDVCPIHMANLGAVVRQLLPSIAERIKVVFITTDPARDTPDRLRTWLGNFHETFIGLTGDTATINAAQRSLYLPTPQFGPADSTGGYEVGHSAAVIAFTPDNRAHVRYPFGIRQADWANDLPKLLEISWPGD